MQLLYATIRNFIDAHVYWIALVGGLMAIIGLFMDKIQGRRIKK